MHCTNCGYDLTDVGSDMKICPQCGIPIAVAEAIGGGAAMGTKGSDAENANRKKWPIPVTIALVAILACVAIFVWPINILGIGNRVVDVKENPIGAAFNGFGEAVDSRGGFDMEVDAFKETTILRIALGEDLKDSVVCVVSGKGKNRSHFIFADDKFAVAEGSELRDPGEYYGYRNVVDGVSELIRRQVGLKIKLNDRVERGQFNDEWLREQGEKLSGVVNSLPDNVSGAVNESAGQSSAGALQGLSQKQLDGFQVVLEGFIYDKCASTDFTKSFVKNLKSDTDGGLTTSKFSFDIPAFAQALAAYLGDVAKDESYLSRNGLASSDVRGLQGLLEIGGTQLENMGIKDVDMSVSVNGKGLLKELKVDYDGSEFALRITQSGGSDVNSEEFKRFVRKMKLEDFADTFRVRDAFNLGY